MTSTRIRRFRFSGEGPPTFVCLGTIYHQGGAIVADNMDQAKFIQIWFIDPAQQYLSRSKLFQNFQN